MAVASARLPGPEAAGHRAGGGVGEEVEDREGGGEDDPGHRQAGELAGAEVPDDGGVGEHVERLGDQRPEGGDRQPHDLPVVRAAQTPVAERGGVVTLGDRTGPLAAARPIAVTPGREPSPTWVEP